MASHVLLHVDILKMRNLLSLNNLCFSGFLSVRPGSVGSHDDLSALCLHSSRVELRQGVKGLVYLIIYTQTQTDAFEEIT